MTTNLNTFPLNRDDLKELFLDKEEWKIDALNKIRQTFKHSKDIRDKNLVKTIEDLFLNDSLKNDPEYGIETEEMAHEAVMEDARFKKYVYLKRSGYIT